MSPWLIARWGTQDQAAQEIPKHLPEHLPQLDHLAHLQKYLLPEPLLPIPSVQLPLLITLLPCPRKILHLKLLILLLDLLSHVPNAMGPLSVPSLHYIIEDLQYFNGILL